MVALELSLRWLLRNFGLKVGTISRGKFEPRIKELAFRNSMLEAATEPMLLARADLRHELAGLERRVRLLAQNDPVCRRLMSMPGIGAVVALTYDPVSMIPPASRFRKRSDLGSASPRRGTSLASATSRVASLRLAMSICAARCVRLRPS